MRLKAQALVGSRFLVAVGVVSLLLGAILFVPPVNAGVDNGGSSTGSPPSDCDGSGIDGCPWTGNGHGWRAIRVNSANAPQGNGYWANANSICAAEGATHVVAYLVFTGEQEQRDAYIYTFPRAWGSFAYYNGTLSVAAAESLFQLVPLDQRRHFSFGSNVGWFCWSEYDYDLNPVISVGNTVEAGTTAYPTGSMTNRGSTGTPSSMQWQVTTFYLDRGVTTIPRAAGGVSNDAPINYYNTGGARGLTLRTHRTGQQFTSSNVAQAVSIPGQQVGDLDTGTTVCYTLSIQPRRHDNDQWRHSPPACAIVAKKPKVQVQGGDLIVGKAFNGYAASGPSDVVTSRTVRTLDSPTRTYGSWVEYGVRATGSVTGIGAGSAYSGGLVSGTVCGANLLTFSNTNGTSCAARERLGYYSNSKAIPDVLAAFTTNRTTPDYTSLAAATQRRVVKAETNITISAGTIQRGDWLVINAAGQTVTIDGNIDYTDQPLGAIGDIPQVVIIADRININPGVSRVDAWLVAVGPNGVIDTCYGVASLNSGVCQNQLTVNGPVMAKSLQLRRTYGAGTGATAGQAAEVFNLRPDAYLWSIARAQSANRIYSVYTKELPPRF